MPPSKTCPVFFIIIFKSVYELLLFVIPASEARRESVTPSVPLRLRGMKGGYSGQAGMTEKSTLQTGFI
jgi:hypothetical protein